MRNNTHFEVGDVVAIREWDDMADEYGLASSGSIACRYRFTRDMEEFCGSEVEISRIHQGRVWFTRPLGGYNYSTDMIRHLDDEIPGAIDMDGYCAIMSL